MKIACCIVFCTLPGIFLLAAQETEFLPWVPSLVAEQSVVKKVEPQYSQMAKIAHVQGEVALSIVISAQGKVASVKALAGHPILINDAVKAVQQWEYRPFLSGGNPHSVTTLVHVIFPPGSLPRKVPDASDLYYGQETKCRGLLNVKAYAEAAAACALLPGLAEKVDTADDRTDQEQASTWSGYAYFKASKFQQALTAWEHRLAMASENDPDSPDTGVAHYNVARALQATGDLEKAKSHYQKAVKILEAARKREPNYAKDVQSVLRDYASLLRQMGESSKADASEKKAESIQLQNTNQQ